MPQHTIWVESTVYPVANSHQKDETNLDQRVTSLRNKKLSLMAFAKENGESAFTFAGKISNAQTFQDIVTLQTQFAQDRMQAFVTQTQQLFSVIEEAIQKSERGTMGAGMGAMPSIPIIVGFKDVQDRAVELAKKNAESALALVEKIGKAQNFQEALTLQARFAQDQTQAYDTQTQELQKMIGEAIQKLQRGSPS